MAVQRRLEFALEIIKAADWAAFEQLSSTFLAAEFSGLRTTASPSGDEGRDAELFRIGENPSVLFQFSVAGDWRSKIRRTIKRLREVGNTPSVLIYMSNQEIGASGDPIKKEAIASGLNLDIRDRNWFRERACADDARRDASNEFAKTIVDPILDDKALLSRASGLGGQEARTALVYLEMQSRDENVSKGLTKSCYEALVKCSLRGTTSENRKTVDQIRTHIQGLLPQHSHSALDPFILAALERLSKTALKKWDRDGVRTYHISHEENIETKDRLAGLLLLNQAFFDDVREILDREPSLGTSRYADIVGIVRSIVETYFYRLGEEFAQTVVSDKSPPLHDDTLKNVVIEHAPIGNVSPNRSWITFLCGVCRDVLSTPSKSTNQFLRLLYNSYTLFAFLSEVPDVQKATKKLFGHGTIWLDTSAILPILAEQAFSEDAQPFTDMMRALRQSKTKLVVTEGCIEEVEGHLNLCKTYTRTPSWKGRVPYLVSQYITAGKPLSGFSAWLENFVGLNRPSDDIADFLFEIAGISVATIPVFDRLSPETQAEVRDYWQRVQDGRRNEGDNATIFAYRLADHDIENYLAVLTERKAVPGNSALGYSSWLLTLDRAAWSLLNSLSEQARNGVRFSPVISLDFLFKYLAFGPRRDLVETAEKGYTRIFSSSVFEMIPLDLIEVADSVRRNSAGLPERLIQRRIRDELDKQKGALGEAHKAGLNGSGAFKAAV